MSFPPSYDHQTREAHWQQQWETRGIYHWRGDKPRDETYVIDTPPPTVSGMLHMGHIYSYTHADFIARYQRMKGMDVFYPMGFDDNGLPTERLVEKTRKKRASDYDSREAFIAVCEEVSEEARRDFRALFTSTALSVDWALEYHTISEHARRVSQASFLDLYAKGQVSRRLQPMLWDPVDQTAIAQAEVEDKELAGTFNDIRFYVDNGITPMEGSLPLPLGEGRGEGKQIIPPHLLERARELRVSSTVPEKILWSLIRDRQLMDAKFRRQHSFPPYIVDFYCHEAKLVIELDGGQHGFDERQPREQQRQQFLESQGLTVLRFWNNEVMENIEGVLEVILESLTPTLSQREREPSHPQDMEQAKQDSFIIGTTRPEMLPACVAVFYHPDDTRYQHLRGKYAITPLFGVRVPILEDDTVDPEKGTGIMMCCTFGDEADIEKWRRHGLETRIILNKYGKLNLDDVRSSPLEGEQVGASASNAHTEGGQTHQATPPTASRDALCDSPSRGALPSVCDALHNLKAAAAREKIIEMLKESGDLVESRPITHAVKCAERSGAPLEILPTQQWFVHVLEHKQALKEKSAACDWKPDWMAKRMEQWIDGLSWDWCISRQRYYGVPFPVWYSRRAGEEGKLLLAAPDQLPVNPLTDLPKGYSRDEVEADTDVMDTWATSALSPQINAVGIHLSPWERSANDSESGEGNTAHTTPHPAPLPEGEGTERFAKLFPADLRPQAHEIIRTWAFYTLAKAHLHHDSIPWKHLMISGWCLAADKTKMSKSKGNVVTPAALLTQHSADAVRYWASTAKLGTDTAFSEDLLKIGRKLVTKLWNASRFAAGIMQASPHDSASAHSLASSAPPQGGSYFPSHEIDYPGHALDRWMLGRVHTAITTADQCFAAYDYAGARAAVEDVFWNDFCDNYLELVKARAYGNQGEVAQRGAVTTIRASLEAILKLFAPFVPHITEEIYSIVYPDAYAAGGSIHARGSWPDASNYAQTDEQARAAGAAALSVLELVRKAKSERGVSIKYPIDDAWVEGIDATTLALIAEDVCAAGSITSLSTGTAQGADASLRDEASGITLHVCFGAAEQQRA